MLRAQKTRRWSRVFKGLLLAIPLVYLAFDLLENAMVFNLLANYPARVTFVATLLPCVTMVKTLASLSAIFLPLGLLSFGNVEGWRNRAFSPELRIRPWS
jgi:hypothetical protein